MNIVIDSLENKFILTISNEIKSKRMYNSLYYIKNKAIPGKLRAFRLLLNTITKGSDFFSF